MLYNYQGAMLPPGHLPAIETLEPEITGIIFGRFEQQVIGYNVTIDGSARDAGNTGFTTALRPGLVLGKITATGKFKQWDPTAADGSQNVAGILLYPIDTQRAAANQDRFLGYVMFGGNLQVGGICIASSSTYGIVGNASEFLLRSQLFNSFRLNDDPIGYNVAQFKSMVAKTADYAVLESDAGTMFTTAGAAGAVNFTLPATPKNGLFFDFFNSVNQNLTVTAGVANTMITQNNAAATSVALSTANQKIGGGFRVMGNGTRWMVLPRVYDSQVVTVA